MTRRDDRSEEEALRDRAAALVPEVGERTRERVRRALELLGAALLGAALYFLVAYGLL